MYTWATGVTQDRRAQKTWLPSNLLRNSAACNWSPVTGCKATPKCPARTSSGAHGRARRGEAVSATPLGCGRLRTEAGKKNFREPNMEYSGYFYSRACPGTSRLCGLRPVLRPAAGARAPAGLFSSGFENARARVSDSPVIRSSFKLRSRRSGGHRAGPAVRWLLLRSPFTEGWGPWRVFLAGCHDAQSSILGAHSFL
jgi:hypothetical protein